LCEKIREKTAKTQKPAHFAGFQIINRTINDLKSRKMRGFLGFCCFFANFFAQFLVTDLGHKKMCGNVAEIGRNFTQLFLAVITIEKLGHKKVF